MAISVIKFQQSRISPSKCPDKDILSFICSRYGFLILYVALSHKEPIQKRRTTTHCRINMLNWSADTSALYVLVYALVLYAGHGRTHWQGTNSEVI